MKRNKIVLFNPRTSPKELNNGDLKSIPLGLLAISSLLDKEGHDIKIIDAKIEPNYKNKILEYIDMEKYITNYAPVNTRTINIYTSQGCPYHCGFCSDMLIYKRRWSGRSSKRVLEELEQLVKTYIKNIHAVLKNNGIAIFTVPNYAAIQIRLTLLLKGHSHFIDYAENKEHIRFFNKVSLINLLEEGDFTIDKVIGSNFFELFSGKLARKIKYKLSEFFPRYLLGLLVRCTK